MKVIDWLNEIKDAKKREKDFRENGEKYWDVYEAEKRTPFNILYSNTETLLPALYSEKPRPVIQPFFQDDDPLGQAASQAAQRMLEYLIESDSEYDKFPDAMEMTTLSALIPGRGVTAVRYDAEIKEYEDTSEVKNETVCTDTIKWDRVYFGFAHKWSKVPWIAYEVYMDKKEATEFFPDMVSKLTFTVNEEKEEKEEKEENEGSKKTARIYQIWDKSSKKVLYITDQYKEDFLRQDDDPLELVGFFNTPKPLQFFKSDDLCPVALYEQYKEQAEELNKIQKRLNKVIDAIKVRGAYDGALGNAIEEILKGDDNDLIPTDKAATLAAEGGLDKAIWLMPIGELVGVAQQLYAARESAKQVIYEITGISDIMRGQSAASETLGAQQIKASWGTMRLKRLQKEVQRYALDLIKLMLEVAASKMSQKTWMTITQLPFPTQEQKQQATIKFNQMKQQVEMQAIQQGQNFQPPPPPDPKFMKLLQDPTWEDILKVLKDDFTRSYRIDIETNSTLDVEATEDKQLVGDFMNAMAQFMNGAFPMIQDGMLPFPAAKAMLLAIVRRYRFGREVEDELKQMQPPKPPSNPQAEQQLQQQKQQLDQQQQQLQKEKQSLDVQKQQFEFDKQLAELQIKHEKDMANLQDKMHKDKLNSEIEIALQKHQKTFQSFFDKQVQRLADLSSKMQQ